jgi:hypothetical protein
MELGNGPEQLGNGPEQLGKWTRTAGQMDQNSWANGPEQLGKWTRTAGQWLLCCVPQFTVVEFSLPNANDYKNLILSSGRLRIPACCLYLSSGTLRIFAATYICHQAHCVSLAAAFISACKLAS